MEKIIQIKGDRIIVERNDEYYERKIHTLEEQEERKKIFNSSR